MDGTEVEVQAVRTVGPETVALELATPDEFDARPGQFVQVAGTVDGEEVARHYTLSSPRTEESFEITVGVDPEGDLSPWLADREAGDAVAVAGPFGNAYYEDESSVVVLAGGPGVGPAVGIGERAVADGNDVTVVYRDDAPAHEDRLDALETDGATVVVTAAPLADDDRVRDALAAAEGQVFVYGFADFLAEAEGVLSATGHDAEDAKTENFG